jgi:GxxExxY protein
MPISRPLRYTPTWIVSTCAQYTSSFTRGDRAVAAARGIWLRSGTKRLAQPRCALQHPGMTVHHEGTKHTKVTKARSVSLSHSIIGAAIEVHRVIGPGLLESVYEMALCRELWLRGHRVDRQVRLPVHYKGKLLDCHIKLDLLVEKTVVIEVKSVERLVPIHTSQLLTYLRLEDLWLGLLINFNVNSLRDGLRRVLNGW